MQWLNLVSEDAGVQRLKAEARQTAKTRGVNAVAPYPKAHPVQIGEDRRTGQKPVTDRRRGERRKGVDRRKQQTAVLLDTRSQHDRRSIGSRRQSDSGNGKAARPSTRINLYA